MSASGDGSEPVTLGVTGRLAASFIDSKLTPLLVLASVLLGVASVVLLPREEEPQIKVPMIDVMVGMPGFSASEVEERATRPMEQLLWEIPGVEYVYSTSRPGESLVIVRFKVGEDIERSLVKLNQKLQSNFDRIPIGVSFPLVKPRSIDDVPILALTFHGEGYDHLTLRRVAAQVQEAVKQVESVAETTLMGGARRQLRVALDPVRLASRNLSPGMIAAMLQQANSRVPAGRITSSDREVIVETGSFLENAEDVESVVVGVFNGKPVHLREVAEVRDGAEDPSQYVFYGKGARSGGSAMEQPGVTLAVAKRPGANAIQVAGDVLRKIETLKGVVIPSDLSVSITRHYGATAAEKSNELLFHMGIAVVSVAVLIGLALGWRESLVVSIAIPSTLALTLLVFYLLGFTLNRITLFALIFSIGILVDDAIVVVENIVRHFHMARNAGRSRAAVAVEAVNEVGNPTLLATWAVIAAVLPMAFVGGLMGPYMRPIPIGASAAMVFSLAIAFMVTPWAALRIFQWRRAGKLDSAAHGHGGSGEGRIAGWYRQGMRHLIRSGSARLVFLGLVFLLLAGSFSGVAIGWVRVKMLPFDNKSEFQVILNMPEGSSLERTAQVAREMAAAVRTEPEVDNYQVYVGTSSPFNFNGLVRHYFLRRGASVADLQVNLVGKHERSEKSHDIAKRVRPRLKAIADRFGARVTVAEVPPGPPVLQTLVAEIYGPTEQVRRSLATRVLDVFESTPGVVDADWYVEDAQPRTRVVVDKEKAALHGIGAETISRTVRLALGGDPAGLLHQPLEKEDVNIVFELPTAHKAAPEDLLNLRIEGGQGGTGMIPLRELVTLVNESVEPSIYHKNLMPVTYVIGDVAGAIESPVYAILKMNQALEKLDAERILAGETPVNVTVPSGTGERGVHILNASLPFSENWPALKWDGEWQITIEVFRDLGLAFIAVLVIIYVLMVGWFRSFVVPVVVMVVIPLSLIGILPAHGFMSAFFTATSMIGFMAGGGIVVRNSIILVDFIELKVKEGLSLEEAVIEAGLVRFRPILLTALAVVVGALVILFDPIFQGLAISLIAGGIVSMGVSPVVVPILYFMVRRRSAVASEA